VTNQQALVALYLLQDFKRGLDAGQVFSTAWLWRQGVLVGLMTESRKASARLVRRTDCLACGAELAADTTGDHVIARANGGSNGLGNYLPMCKRCNSSKGTRGLLEWWRQRGRHATELPPDVLAVYARLTFRFHLDRETHNTAAPTALREAVQELIGTLPTPEHERALRRRVGTVTGKVFDG
jgi:HNH endonuclease